MTTTVIRHTALELIWQNALIEARYPDFLEIAEADLRCCGLDEVADRYGWGDATSLWEQYEGNRFLLGD